MPILSLRSKLWRHAAGTSIVCDVDESTQKQQESSSLFWFLPAIHRSRLVFRKQPRPRPVVCEVSEFTKPQAEQVECVVTFVLEVSESTSPQTGEAAILQLLAITLSCDERVRAAKTAVEIEVIDVELEMIAAMLAALEVENV